MNEETVLSCPKCGRNMFQLIKRHYRVFVECESCVTRFDADKLYDGFFEEPEDFKPVPDLQIYIGTDTKIKTKI